MPADISQNHYNVMASKVQKRLSIFKKANESHHETIGRLKEKIDAKKGQLVFMGEEVKTQQTQKDSLTQEINDFKGEVKEQTKYFNDLCDKNNIDVKNDPALMALENDIHKHEADLNKHAQIAAQLQQKAEQCAAAVKSIEDHAGVKEEAAMQLAAELKEHMDSHEEKDAAILRLRGMAANLAESHDGLNKDHSSAQDTLSMLQEAVAEHKNGVNYAQMNCDDLYKKAKVHQAEIAKSKAEKKSLASKIARQEADHKTGKQERARVLGDIQNQIANMKGLTEDQKTRMAAYEKDQMDIVNETEEKKALLLERARMIKGHENDKEWLRTHLGDIDAKINALSQDINEKKADMAKQHLSNKEEMLLKKTEHAAEITELKKEFQEHMSAHDRELWAKKTDAQKQAAQLKFLQQHGDELARHIGDMSSHFENKHEQHMNVQTEVGEKQIMLTNLISQAANLDDQIDAFEKAMKEVTATHQTEMASVNADVNKHAAEVEGHKRKQRDLANMSQSELANAMSQANKSQNDAIYNQQRHDAASDAHRKTAQELNDCGVINNAHANNLARLQGDLAHHTNMNSNLQDEHDKHENLHSDAKKKAAEFKKLIAEHEAHAFKTTGALDADLQGLLASTDELQNLHSDHKLTAKEEAARWGDIIVVAMRDMQSIGENIKETEAQNTKLALVASQYETLLETLIDDSRDPYASDYDDADAVLGLSSGSSSKVSNDDIMSFLSFARCAAYVLNPSDVVDFATKHGLDIDQNVINEEFTTLRSNPASLGLKPLPNQR